MLARPTHVFAADGTYPVGLTVTDNDGATSAVSTQNVAVAAPAVYATDGFGRTTTTGWGSADTGGAWTVAGSASNYSVDGSVGHVTDNPGSTPSAYLAGVVAGDTTGTVDVSLAALPVLASGQTSNPSQSIWVTVRHSAAAEYQLQLKILVDGIRVAAVAQAGRLDRHRTRHGRVVAQVRGRRRDPPALPGHRLEHDEPVGQGLEGRHDGAGLVAGDGGRWRR